MGSVNQMCSFDDTNPNIMAATLNFSGICLSPFEYHDCSIEKDVMSDTFSKIMKKYIDDQKFSWQVGKIDLKLQKERYTPIYRKEVCVVNGRLINREQFEELWDKQFQKYKGILKASPPNEDQIKQAKLFDWISYETLYNEVYKQNEKKLLNLEKIKEVDATKFIKFLEAWHSKAYLNNLKKMYCIAQFLKRRRIDVLLLQEAETRQEKSWRQVLPPEYQYEQRENCQSLVIYKKTKFPINQIVKQQAFNQYKNLLNFNKDTTFIRTQNNFLLISAHLTSKATNIQQGKQMIENIRKIQRQAKEKNIDLKIICGVDSNHFMQPSQFKGFKLIPDVETESTTSKKRTMMQLQTRKANVIVIETKDHLITNMPLQITDSPKSPFIGMISGGAVHEKVYLPSEEHPFDHFLIMAELTNNQHIPVPK